jgi:hypothetical protein
MGLPTTWFMLNLAHLFWIDYATMGIEEPIRSRLQQSTAICGDDLLAFWPQKVVDRYHKVLKECHARISPGKHFISSIGRGVFTEKAFFLPQTKQEMTKIRKGVGRPGSFDFWLGRNYKSTLNEG